MKTTIKNSILFLLAIIFLVAINIYLNSSKKVNTENNLKVYNSESIKEFDGADLSKPVYMAYDGYVFDVTPGREDFYNEGMPYHYLAGKDSTTELNIAGGAIIKSKYKIIGIYKK